ncbi:MAG: hypothetical protein NTW12_09560 [Deltaproteobacteria bacterium]|nr:hypothetical protein [Deltaproteobacteria bacterium]
MQEIKPLFDFTTNKSNTLIHQSSAEISINQHTYTGNGEVRLELVPRANIYFYGYFQGVSLKDAMDVFSGQTDITTFSINSRQFEGFRLSSGGDANSQEFHLKWCPKSEPVYGVGDESTKMSLLVFHIFNFVDLLGTHSSVQKDENGMHRIEHVDLMCVQWHVELKSLLSTREEIKKLKEEGGYRLTHVGGIKRVDNALFSGKDAQECLKALRFFLSFAKGGWCEPICVVGFDESGNRVWESWSSPMEPWHVPLSWFDHHTGSQLTALFPIFMRKWEDGSWRDALEEVIYWYLNANFSSRGIDAGIILTQAAIERLSYEYAVKDKRLLLLNGFKDLWASDKFRLLFSSLKIPLEIPSETPEIAKLARDFNWLDTPHALTEIRNSLVHPEHKRRGQLDSVYYEAWNLGLWYLSMGLLAVCDYAETYGNRLMKKRIVGQVEKVPWG